MKMSEIEGDMVGGKSRSLEQMIKNKSTDVEKELQDEEFQWMEARPPSVEQLCG